MGSLDIQSVVVPSEYLSLLSDETDVASKGQYHICYDQNQSEFAFCDQQEDRLTRPTRVSLESREFIPEQVEYSIGDIDKNGVSEIYIRGNEFLAQSSRMYMYDLSGRASVHLGSPDEYQFAQDFFSPSQTSYEVRYEHETAVIVNSSGEHLTAPIIASEGSIEFFASDTDDDGNDEIYVKKNQRYWVFDLAERDGFHCEFAIWKNISQIQIPYDIDLWFDDGCYGARWYDHDAPLTLAIATATIGAVSYTGFLINNPEEAEAYQPQWIEASSEDVTCDVGEWISRHSVDDIILCAQRDNVNDHVLLTQLRSLRLAVLRTRNGNLK